MSTTVRHEEDSREPRLVLERKSQPDGTGRYGGLLLTPAIDEDYWEYRVRLSDKQAVVGFPKFGTIGIGFAAEDDRNTNLPFTCPTDEIVEHILHNKGDDAISRDDVHAAVALVRDAAWADDGAKKLLDVIDRMAQDPAYIHGDYAQRVVKAMVERTGWTR